MVGRPIRVTATGNVAGAATGGTVRGLSITPGTTATTVTIRENGSGGNIIYLLLAAANSNSFALDLTFRFEGQLHVTLAGTGAEVTVNI